MTTTLTSKDPMLSRDATVALALARTSLPFAATRAEEAERWPRVLRVHGQVGVVLQALGVGEASLEAASNGHDPRGRRHEGRRPDETVTDVCCRTVELADSTGADTVGTIHILSPVLAVYGEAFDLELSRRGTSCDEVPAQLGGEPALAAARA
jgi:hypothetical protein